MLRAVRGALSRASIEARATAPRADASDAPRSVEEDRPHEDRHAADMLAWQAGDADAFDRLHASCADRLWRVVRRSTADREMARELYQDIWMRVIDRRDEWRPEGRVIGWLFTIARHRLADHARSEGRRPVTDEALGDDERGVSHTLERPLTPEERAMLVENDARVQRALDALPDAQREAIVLHHVAGLTLAEIASATDQPREAVKSRLRYGAQRLRRRLRGALQESAR